MDAKTFPPTPEQVAIREALRSSSASLIIRAYAGCGKTSTLTLIAQDVKGPALSLAFNKDIAEELKLRLPSSFHVKTLNGLGHSALGKALRKHPKVDSQKLSKILKEFTSGFSKDEWSATREAVRLAMQAGIVPERFSATRGMLPDTPDGWEEALGEPLDGKILEAARQALTRNIEVVFSSDPVISFDDQIYMPLLFSGVWPRYPMVFCDEVQDFSPMNHLMLSKVSAGRIVAVGDPCQAIYKFRGAATNSMSLVKDLKEEWIELPLATTFRCPKAVVERCAPHAPGFRAADNAPQGRIIDLVGDSWHWRDLSAMIPPGGSMAVLCRNNAPLLRLAMRLLRRQIGCKVLGKDIAQGLKNLAKKILPKDLPSSGAINLVRLWAEKEVAALEASGKDYKVAGIRDREESLVAILEGTQHSSELPGVLDKMFKDDEKGLVVLATAHKAKGLEWDLVLHLDPWRIPSKYASEKGGEDLAQEYNIEYVLETRTKHTLVLANLKEMV